MQIAITLKSLKRCHLLQFIAISESSFIINESLIYIVLQRDDLQACRKKKVWRLEVSERNGQSQVFKKSTDMSVIGYTAQRYESTL